MNGRSVEIGHSSNAAPINEREVKRESLKCTGHAITARAAQFDKVIRRGNGDEEASFGAQDSRTCCWIASGNTSTSASRRDTQLTLRSNRRANSSSPYPSIPNDSSGRNCAPDCCGSAWAKTILTPLRKTGSYRSGVFGAKGEALPACVNY